MALTGRTWPTFLAAMLVCVICTLAGAGVAMAQAVEPAVPGSGGAVDRAPQAAAQPAHAIKNQDRIPEIEPAGHGWFALPAGPNRGTALLHLPPRPAATGVEPGVNAVRSRSAEGVVRFAPGFQQPADFVAWWQNRVYIAIKSDRTAPIGKADFQQRILTLSANQSAGGGWEYPPGRPEVAATLPARSVELIAFGACRLGPVALLRHSPRTGTKGQWVVPPSAPDGKPDATSVPRSGDLELLLYASAQWRRIDLPWQGNQPQSYARFWLAGAANELVFDALDAEAPAVREYTLELPVMVAPKERVLNPSWRSTTYPLVQHTANTDLAIPLPDLVCRVEGTTVAIAWTADNRGEVRLFWLRPDRSAEEGPAVQNVPRQHLVVPMDGSGRIAVIWPDPVAEGSPAGQGGGADSQMSAEPTLAAPGSSQTGLQICEVSATTGKVLYRGPLKSNYWLTTREYQVLVAMLVVVMGAVLVFVLRAEPSQSANLPKGVVLAEPSRRFLAAVIDYLPAALLVETLFSLPTGTLLLPSQMLGEQFTVWALLTAFGLAAAHSTLGEWLFGRSLGKLLTGCVVASVRPRAAGAGSPASEAPEGEQPLSRPVFWQCLARNIIKWFAPILGLFILVDVSRRHPGDLVAKTLVLMTDAEAAGE